MSAIREWTATLGEAARSAAAVNWIGKWKTATQVCWCTVCVWWCVVCVVVCSMRVVVYCVCDVTCL